MKFLDSTSAEKLIQNSSVLFEVNEYSESLFCYINACYYQIDSNHFIEHITRKYSRTGEIQSGYLMHESPSSILYVLIHSEDKKLRKMADTFVSKYLKTNALVELNLPDELHANVKCLAKRFDCSVETMLTNLISQGLQTENDLNSFYDMYDRRNLVIKDNCPF